MAELAEGINILISKEIELASRMESEGHKNIQQLKKAELEAEKLKKKSREKARKRTEELEKKAKSEIKRKMARLEKKSEKEIGLMKTRFEKDEKKIIKEMKKFVLEAIKDV